MIQTFINDKPDNPTGLEGIDILHRFMKKKIDGYDVSDVLLQPTLIDEAIQHTKYKNLDILPASSNLIETDRKLKDKLYEK